MKSKIFLIGALTFMQNVYAHPHNIRQSTYGSGLTARHQIGQPITSAASTAAYQNSSPRSLHSNSNTLQNKVNLSNFASRFNPSSLAQNVLGTAGSFGTSSAMAQGVAKNVAGYGLAGRRAGNSATGGYTVASNSVVDEAWADGHDWDEEIELECPEGREVIGYVEFEGYLPVEGTVKVAENECGGAN